MTDTNGTTTPELTAEQKRELFENYEKSREKVRSANASLDNSVRIIHAHLGAGPFRWQGQEIAIRKARKGDRLAMIVKGESVEEIG